MPEDNTVLSSVRLLNLIQSSEPIEVEKPGEWTSSLLEVEESTHRQFTIPVAPELSGTIGQKLETVDLIHHHPFSRFDQWTARTMAGLEITRRAIRLVKVSSKRNRFDIRTTEELELSEGTEDSDRIMHLRQLNRKYGLASTSLVSILNGSDINIRLLKMPRVSRKEIHDALLWKNKKELHFFNDAPTVLHYMIIDEEVSTRSGEFFVLVVAAKEERIRQHLELLDRAGLEPCKLIVRPIAKAALIQRLPTSPPSCAIVDIGYQSTELAFFNGASLHFAREVAVGGDHFTQALTQTAFAGNQSCTLSWRQAEELKRKIGLDPVDPLGEFAGFPLSELAVLMRPIAEKFVNEIKLSLEYYCEQFKNQPPTQIILTGGGSRMPSVASFLRESLSLPVVVAQVEPSDKNAGASIDQCLNAIGAALSTGSEFNILPKTRILNERLRRMTSWVWSLGTLLVAILSTAVFLMTLTVSLDDEKLASSSSALMVIESQQKSFDEIQRNSQKIDAHVRQILSDVKRDTGVVVVLKTISNLVPESIKLTTLAWGNGYNEVETERLRTLRSMETKIGRSDRRGKRLQIAGMVYKDLFYADVHLMRFMSALKQTNAFEEIELQDKNRTPKDETLSFELVLWTKDNL